MNLKNKNIIQSLKISRPKTQKASSLSAYFPKGTMYFYGYPAGTTADFLNNASPLTEELVAARIQSCSGPNVSVVTFASTEPPLLKPDLIKKFNIPEATAKHALILPESIDINVRGVERNKAIISALTKALPPKSLVMAEPFMDDRMQPLYQIKPEIVMWLNDKSNMAQFIDASLMPNRIGNYDSGKEFYKTSRSLSLPCVVKIPSSSSGDGVVICKDRASLEKARDQFKNHSGTILVEQFIEAKKNYAIHFGIPHDPKKPIAIFGFNEQITSQEGAFLGGIISSRKIPAALRKVRLSLLKSTLPRIRKMGWYGIGGFDVMIDSKGDPFIIDCNFRMTGLSAYHFLVANKTIKAPIVSFGGAFNGTQLEFEKAISPFASLESRTKEMQIIALSHHQETWDFNAAISYRNTRHLKSIIQALHDSKIDTPALEQLRKVI